MKFRLLTYSVLCILMYSMSSCYYDIGEELYPAGSLSNCDTTNVSYLSDIRPLIDSKCATSGCHVAGGSAPGDYSVFQNLKIVADNGKLENRVIVLETMPPSGALSNCDQLKIQQWINNGANDN